jgi:hypothetical protein
MRLIQKNHDAEDKFTTCQCQINIKLTDADRFDAECKRQKRNKSFWKFINL